MAVSAFDGAEAQRPVQVLVGGRDADLEPSEELRRGRFVGVEGAHQVDQVIVVERGRRAGCPAQHRDRLWARVESSVGLGAATPDPVLPADGAGVVVALNSDLGR